MARWIKQSTSAVISFGPFVDKGDGVTLETGLVSALDHASTGIMLSKNGGALTIRHASVTASSYDAYGNYLVTLDTTDTNTLGSLRMQFSEAATCLPVWQDLMVVPANVWDSMFGSSLLKTDLDTIKTQAITCAAGVTVLASVGTAATSTAQTGDSYAIVNSGTFGNSALKTLIDTVDNLIDNEIGDISSNVATTLIEVDTILQDLQDGGRLDLLVDAIKAKTDGLPASPAAVGSAMTLTSAYDFAKGTVAMTEAYAALGATVTPAQALHQLIAMLNERSISGTTLTAKKLDGSTSAMTFTLDSATAPTSQTRAS